MKCRPVVARGNIASIFDTIGDMSEPGNLDRLEEFVDHLCPDMVVCDLHPEYFSSDLAHRMEKENGVKRVAVQHHRAHVASVCMENGLFDENVVGLSFDGTGYGDDGSIWGGEFFIGSVRQGFSRKAHFASLPLPGGDSAVREPWRIVLALLTERGSEPESIHQWLPNRGVSVSEDDLEFLQTSLRSSMRITRSTSLGRWFDLTASLLGVLPVAEVLVAQFLAKELDEAHQEPSFSAAFISSPISLRMFAGLVYERGQNAALSGSIVISPQAIAMRIERRDRCRMEMARSFRANNKSPRSLNFSSNFRAPDATRVEVTFSRVRVCKTTGKITNARGKGVPSPGCVSGQ